MKKLLFLLILVVVACGGNKYQQLKKASSVSEDNFDCTIPFSYENNVMLVEVVIKQKTYRLIFDTGASTSVLSKQAADALGLKPKTYVEVVDSRKQSERLSVSSIDTLLLGNVRFLDQVAIIVEWPEYSIFRCKKIDGLLGITAIRKANWVIDYRQQTMRFMSNALEDSTEFNFTPLSRSSTRPNFKISVDSIEIENVLMDLGSGGFVDLDHKAMNEAFGKRMDNLIHGKNYDGSSQGLFGSLMDTVLEINPNSLSVGNTTMYNPIITLENNKTQKFGNRFYEQYTLYLDFQKHRFGLKPFKDSTVYKSRKSFGFVPFLQDSIFSVVSIHSNSQGFIDGVRAGDEILSINGITPNSLDYDFCKGLTFLSTIKDTDTITIIFAKQPKVENRYYRTVH